MGDLQTHYGSTSETQAPGARSIAPGRVAATARLAPRGTASPVNAAAATAPTMSPTVAGEPAPDPFGIHLLGEQVHQDLKQPCDQHGPGCFLAAPDVARLMREIDGNIISARENWTTALLNKRINLAGVHAEGWNLLWKGAAMLAMAGVGAGVGLGLEFIAAAAESITAVKAAAALVNNEEKVRHLFAIAGGVLEGKAAAAVSAAANEGTGETSAYVESQLDKPGLWANTLLKTYPKQLDHYGLVLLRGMTDPGNFTVAAFTAQIDVLLAQWATQVQAVGDGGSGYKQTVAWVFPRGGGGPRLARVTAFAPPGKLANNLVPQGFVAWVASDLVSLALAEADTHHVNCTGMTTLADLAGAPTDEATVTWDRGAIANTVESAQEPDRAYSHEDRRGA